MTRKLTIEQVREAFAAKGRILLDDVYKGQAMPMRYRCHCGEEREASLVATRASAGGCPKCNDYRVSQKYTQEEIEQIYREGGCEFLDTFKTTQDTAKYRCKCGREVESRVA